MSAATCTKCDSCGRATCGCCTVAGAPCAACAEGLALVRLVLEAIAAGRHGSFRDAGRALDVVVALDHALQTRTFDAPQMPAWLRAPVPRNAENYATVRAELEPLKAFRALGETDGAFAALEAIRQNHQHYIDAASRVTERLNKEARHLPRREAARRVRVAMGNAYMGGPLL